jgi:phospholipase C
MTFNFKTNWRTTTALCIVSTIAFATTAYAANFGGLGGLGGFGALGALEQLIIDIENDLKIIEGGNSKGGGSSNPTTGVKTASPIKHVIVLIGENRGLDHTFGVYKPKGAGQTISNLLSKGIVNEDGTPGPNFALSQQFSVAAQANGLYYIGAPAASKLPYNAVNLMPQPNTNGAPETTSTTGAPFQTVAEVAATGETDIAPGSFNLLTTGAVGLTADSLDTRVPGAGTLNGSFALQGSNLNDDDYTGDTTHRFYQDWQQSDCSVATATKSNTSGCLADLFPFVMDTYDRSATKQGNFSEGNSLGFYNAQNGEAAFLKGLADRFTLSDNFHQSFHGGTGANHFMFGTGDAAFWSDGNGNPITPPANQIANPNPVSGTVNKYTADNNFSNCSDATQPGVGPIVDYLNNLSYAAEPNCAENTFYMLDNSNPGYLPNGALANGEGGIPPSPVRTIGDSLNVANITWAYYGGSYNDAVILSNEAVTANAASPNLSLAAVNDPAHALGVAYCQICNPFQYATSIMGNPTQRAAHIKDTTDLITAIQNNTLPSVSIGKPDGLLDGHPSSSKVDLFEAYVTNILTALDANPALRAETAVFITWDEAGGYWDSGFIQSIDFFGDGPRIPILILSAYSTGGKVYHNYGDHVSILKFIERNWNLQPLTNRSRDNLPNPTFKANNPYVPTNSPALADLFDAFDFNVANNIPYTE